MEELRQEKQRQEEQRRQAQLEKEKEQEKTENNRKAETDRRAEVTNLPRTHARTHAHAHHSSPTSCLLRCATGLFPSSLSLASGLDGRRAALPLVGSRGRAHDADVPHHRHHFPHGRHISRLPPVRGLTTFIIIVTIIITIFFIITITSASNRLTRRRHASAIISVSSLAAAAYPWSNGNAPQFSSGGATASSPASGKDFYRREMDQRLYSKMV